MKIALNCLYLLYGWSCCRPLNSLYLVCCCCCIVLCSVLAEQRGEAGRRAIYPPWTAAASLYITFPIYKYRKTIFLPFRVNYNLGLSSLKCQIGQKAGPGSKEIFVVQNRLKKGCDEREEEESHCDGVPHDWHQDQLPVEGQAFLRDRQECQGQRSTHY